MSSLIVRRTCSADSCTDPFKVAPRTDLPPQSLFLQHLDSLPLAEIDRPKYETAIGAYFDPDWIKAAKTKRRKEMKQPPAGLDLDDDDDARHSPPVVGEDEEQPLNLVAWEDNIIFTAL